MGFVGYRDTSDSNRIESMDFDTAESLESFLDYVEPDGGCGGPCHYNVMCEDVNGGLEAALNLSWSKTNKVLIHIADYPGHGYLQGCQSIRNGRDTRGLAITDLIVKIKQMGIDYTFGEITENTDSMVEHFKKIGGEKFVRCADMSDVKNFPFAAIESISATIESNFRSMVGAGVARGGMLSAISEASTKTLKSYNIVEEQPDWTKVPHKKVRIGSCKVSPHPIVKGKMNVTYTYRDAKIQIANNPFAEGSQRLSYFGIEVGKSVSNFLSAMGRGKATVVFKTFKHVYERTHGDGKDDFYDLVETEATSTHLAQEFNKIKPTDAKEVDFLDVKLMEVSKDLEGT